MTHRNEYRKRLVAISNYMQKFRVPSMVQVILVIIRGLKVLISH